MISESALPGAKRSRSGLEYIFQTRIGDAASLVGVGVGRQFMWGNYKG